MEEKMVTKEMIREVVLYAIFEHEEVDIDTFTNMYNALHADAKSEACWKDRIRLVTEDDGSYTLQYINLYGVTTDKDGKMNEEDRKDNICFSFNTRHMAYATVVDAFIEAVYLTVNT